MKYKVVMTDHARDDARAIYDYIAYEKMSPGIADALLDRIEEQILKLNEMPYRYKEYALEPWKSRGLRIMPIESYIACYITDDNTKTVTIIRLFYSRQNIDEHLKKI